MSLFTNKNTSVTQNRMTDENRGFGAVIMFVCALFFWLLQLQQAFSTIDNTAVAVGVFNTSPVISPSSSASIPVIPAAPGMIVNKVGVLNDDDGTPGLSAGDTISYSVDVTNTGNVSLTGIIVVDPLVALTFQTGDIDTDNEIDPGEVWIYTGTYTVTALDLSTNGGGDGDIDNTVNVTSNEIGVVPGTAETPIDPNVGMTVTKTGVFNDSDGTPGLSAGDTIDYQIEVSNVATTDLTNIVLTDVLEQSGVQTPLVPVLSTGDLNLDNRINAGEVWIYTVSYTLTQDDIDDAGDIINTATASSDEIGPRDGTDTQTLSGVVESYTMTKLAVLADADADLLADVGEEITFTFRFTNTGNRTLANLLVIDPLPGLSAISCANDGDTDGDIDLLSPGQTLDCTATYTVAPTDVAAGEVTNVATSSATRTNGIVPVTEDDTANDNSTTTFTDSNFTLQVEKTVDAAVEILPNVVQIDYRIAVTNPEPITQTNVRVQDDIAAAISAPAEIIGIASITSVTGFTGAGGANAGFDGVSDTELLSGDVQLQPVATGEVFVRVLVDRKAQSLETLNVALATTDRISGSVPSDDPGETPSDPGDVNPTPFNSPDPDGDGSPDGNESPTGDRDGDGTADSEDYDPTGYFYCEADGRILSGGLIAVENLTAGGIQTGIGTSNDINILQDGSNGFYQFYVTSPGSYRLILTLPPTGIPSPTLLSSGTLDATSLLPNNPGVLGSGEVGATGVLADPSAGANPFFTEFDIEVGDPTIFNNNIPLAFCGTPVATATKEVAAGPDIQLDGSSDLTYRLTIENTGNDRLDNASLTDNLDTTFGAGNYRLITNTIENAPAGFGATINAGFDGSADTSLLTTGGNLEAGESVSVLLALNVDPIPGAYTNTVTAGGDSPFDGSPLPTDDATVEVDLIGGGATDGVVVVKSTPVDSAPLGSSVPYTITYQNNNVLPVVAADLIDRLPRGFTYVVGSARVNGAPLEPTINLPDLVWSNQSIAPGATTTITLQIIIGAGVTGTEFTNYAFAFSPLENAMISNKAQATIRLEIESVFQCSHIIGRVFDDLNKDGYHDQGEPGIAGARLATVNGLLITTDEFGRYHITCDAIPDDRIGSNYILKLDERTLPTGYNVTSENPRVVRLTRGKLSKINFASANLRRITLALEEASFINGTTNLKPEAIRDIARILPVLEEERSVLVLQYTSGEIDRESRLKAVEDLIEDAWGSRDRPHDLEIELGR